MLSIHQADQILFENILLFPVVKRNLKQTYERILRQTIRADRDQPASDLAQMDGYAISFDAWKKGQRSFQVGATQRAGAPPKKLPAPALCLEIFTGAALPKGCDCVIPIEDLSVSPHKIVLPKHLRLMKWQFVRRQGSEHRKNAVLLTPGLELTPPRIAVAASTGKSTLSVTKTPRIAIIGTGDEIVPVIKSIKTYQSRRSNVYAIDAALNKKGFTQNKIFHLKDDPKSLLSSLKKIINEFDVCVISGAISMGKFDFVPQILKQLKVRLLIHKVQQRPGKPFLFARTARGKPVFGLPGNPASTLVCLYRYVLPYLLRMRGEDRRWKVDRNKTTRIINQKLPETKDNFTRFYPVKISHLNGRTPEAKIIPFKSSGDYAAWARSDGFVEIPGKGHKVTKSQGHTPADSQADQRSMVKFYAW